jgi:hypothetical protein
MSYKLIKLGWLYPSTSIYKRADISLEEIEKVDLRPPRPGKFEWAMHQAGPLGFLLGWPYLRYKKRKLWEKVRDKYNLSEPAPEFALRDLQASIDFYKILTKLIENPDFVNELRATNEGQDILEALFNTPDVSPKDIKRNKELYQQMALIQLDDIKRRYSAIEEWKQEVMKI